MTSRLTCWRVPPCRTKVKLRLETAYGEWVERIPAWIKWATQVGPGRQAEEGRVLTDLSSAVGLVPTPQNLLRRQQAPKRIKGRIMVHVPYVRVACWHTQGRVCSAVWLRCVWQAWGEHAGWWAGPAALLRPACVYKTCCFPWRAQPHPCLLSQSSLRGMCTTLTTTTLAASSQDWTLPRRFPVPGVPLFVLWQNPSSFGM